MNLSLLNKLNMLELFLSIPKTIYFNFKVLPIRKAIKMPFVISYHIKLKNINKKTFIVNFDDLSFASSRIGFEYTVGSFNKPKRGLLSTENGAIVLNGNIGLSQGVVMSAKNSKISLGNNFRCNYSTIISSCDDDIVIGDNVVFGWEITVKSDDGHYIIENQKVKSKSLPVLIGNHVWVCSKSTLLKGAHVGDNCVISYGSLVTNRHYAENSLIGGMPASVIKDNINWLE